MSTAIISHQARYKTYCFISFFEDDFANRRQVEQRDSFQLCLLSVQLSKVFFSPFCSWRFNSSRIKLLLLSIVSAYVFFENDFTNRRQVEQKRFILAMVISLGINSFLQFYFFSECPKPFASWFIARNQTFFYDFSKIARVCSCFSAKPLVPPEYTDIFSNTVNLQMPKLRILIASHCHTLLSSCFLCSAAT